LASAKAKSPRKDWYSISVDTLRGWGFLLLAVAVLGGGYLVYRFWERHALEREAAQGIEDVGQLFQRLQGAPPAGSSKADYDAAVQGYEEARGDYLQGDYRSAVGSARRSRNILLSLLDLKDEPAAQAQASFISVQGNVELRRLEGGDWEEAKSHTPLRPGDYVRTAGNGSAEIMFADRSVYTVRPNTQFIVAAPAGGAGAQDQTIEMEFGWVDLATTAHPNNVKTPGAEARVQHDSEAYVTFDKTSKKGRYGTLHGGMDVESKGGLKRSVQPFQQVVQTGDLLSAPQAMPNRPQPLEPADNLEVDPSKVDRLVLAWQPVSGVSRYALQVSRNHLFVDNVIDADRAKTRATLGIRGEGSFQWRVAAYGKDGSPGPWSAARRFRIASLKTGGGDKSADPPSLDLEDVKSYGSIFIVRGKSDPGVRIEVNGEAVKVGADGSFQKTVQFTKEGLSFIEIRARNGWGIETVRRHRVFVENP
jgi:FecR protein